MALPLASPQRQLRHRRAIQVQVFACGDGLWEVDATITDTRTHDVVLAADVRKAGDPIHDMLLRIVVDEQFNIVDAGAQTRSMPYPGACENHGDTYGKLVGLNLMNGFRHAVRQRLGGIAGCTHITELTQVLPTAVVQAFAGTVINTRQDDSPDGVPPFQLDRCHALRRDGESVRTFYPRWYLQPANTPAATPSDEVAASSRSANVSKKDHHENS